MINKISKKNKIKSKILHELSYRMPMYVTKFRTYTNSNYSVCPRCNISLEREFMSFCNNCGQNLSWDIFSFDVIDD